ncbi:Protein kinase-like domain containing protein [Elaphomyces granulatus]
MTTAMAVVSFQDSGKSLSFLDSGNATSLQGGVEEFSGEAPNKFLDNRKIYLSLLDGVRAKRALRDSLKRLKADLANPPQGSDQVDCGDFVDWDGENEVEVSAEAVEYYHRELPYYPICIGDVLLQTYRIEHKLGHDDFSTVWLARDIQEEKDVALKIMIPGDAGEDEYKMQTEILSTMQDTSNFLTYQKTFFLPGHHGDLHRVLVFPVRGPSIRHLSRTWENLGYVCLLEEVSVATRMSGARQLLKALEQLHNAGIVHQDLNDGNVMWDVRPLDNFDTETKYRHLGRPQKMALSSQLWKRGELVKPLQVPKAMLKKTVYLGGFGMSIKAGTEVEEKVLWPIDYYAPERFHNVKPSFASDMWSYMCLFAQLYLGTTPWHHNACVRLMNHMVDSIGPMPEQWKGHYKAVGRCDDSWYDQKRKPDPVKTLEAQIRHLRPDVGPTERNHVLSIMSKGFSYLPEDRLSATHLLQDASFKAVMEIYCG